MKYKVGYSLTDESYFVFNGKDIFVTDLSQSSAERVAQFLNTQEYLNTDPKQRVVHAKPQVNFDFDSIYERYPRHEGKKQGLERLKKTVTTPEKYQLLVQALEHYCQQTRASDAKFIKMFSSWTNCWEDYIPEGSMGGGEQQVSFDDITGMVI